MADNFFSPWVDGATDFEDSEMNAPLEDLDKAITYLKNVMVHCDGSVTYNSGTGQLAWSSTLRVHFIREDGYSIQNTIATGNVTLSDNQFAYVDLNETNDTELTVSAAGISTGAASNFVTVNRLVLGMRNAASDDYYPVYLDLGSGGGMSNIIEDTSPELGGDLTLGENSLVFSASLSTNEAAEGFIESGTVDVDAVGFGAALFIADDFHYETADASLASMMPVVAMSLATGTGTKNVLLQGFVRDDSWSWSKGLIYMSTTTGLMSQTQPSGAGDQVQVLGFAKSATVMFFNPSLVLVEI